MKIKIFNFVLTYDQSSSKTVILSTDSDNIILPYFIIENPKSLHQEIRYLTKKLFSDPTVKYIEMIDISFLDVHNEFLIDYVKSIENYDYNENEDLCLFCGIIMNEKHMTHLHWLPISKNIDTSIKNNTIDLLIDHTIKNIIS